MNEFSIGGLTDNFHNQVVFAGLREGTFYSSSIAEAMIALRYQLFSNVLITGKANVLFNNFVTKSNFFVTPDFLSGYALTFTYMFALGPLELSAMYCDQSRSVLGYLNIGIPFLLLCIELFGPYTHSTYVDARRPACYSRALIKSLTIVLISWPAGPV